MHGGNIILRTFPLEAMFSFPILILAFVFSTYPVFAEEATIEPAVNKTSDDMAPIEAGFFRMGCNEFGPEHGAPEHDVYLDSFMIDKYEVTNKKYEEVFPDHKLRRSRFSHCDDCPVTKVQWYSAADFCYLKGKSLPTEAQWEKATGAKNGCDFPWGTKFDKQNPSARGGFKLKDSATPVGSFEPNKYGVYDSSGNVWEWVLDWYASYYTNGDKTNNPRGPQKGRMKIRRGGSWSDTVISMRSGYRDWSYPSSRSFSDIGFRCVLNPNSSSKDLKVPKN